MNTEIKQCPACATEFRCNSRQQAASCWCRNYPAIMAVEKSQHCFCPKCLANLAGESINLHLQTLSLKEALALASRYRSSTALTENIDYTLDAGNLVFSRWYHLKRGNCCGNGCRHCPYN